MGRYFSPSQLKLLERAVFICEDLISDAFGLTTDYWIRNPFEVKTLRDSPVDVPENAYAQLTKYERSHREKISATDSRHMYKIILIDPKILSATMGSDCLLMPFFIYIMTHELLHIVRFSKYQCSIFETCRAREEGVVHSLTEKLLSRVPIEFMKEVINFFNGIPFNLRIDDSKGGLKKCPYMNISVNPAV